MNRISTKWSLSFLALVASCGSSFRTVPTEDAFRASGLERASFELRCPAQEIRVTVLTSGECLQRDDGRHVCSNEQVGVEGCNLRTTYVFPPLGGGDEWVRDSEIIGSQPSTETGADP